MTREKVVEALIFFGRHLALMEQDSVLCEVEVADPYAAERIIRIAVSRICGTGPEMITSGQKSFQTIYKAQCNPPAKH